MRALETVSARTSRLAFDNCFSGDPGKIDADFERFHDLVTAAPGVETDTSGLGKLAVFAGVREYPMRVKCATLAWHTLTAALEGNETATTE